MLLLELRMKVFLLSPLLMLSVDGATWSARFNVYSIGRNQDAVMECDIGAANFVGFYKKNNVKIEENDRIKISKENSLMTLDISRVTEADFGNYICKDSNNGSATVTLEILVSLEQAPESPQILLAGEPGDVKVRVYGMPKPRITWSLKRVNKTMEVIAAVNEKGNMTTNVDGLYKIDDEGTLKINKIRAIDAGTYEVKISLSGSRSFKSVQVKVEFKLELKTKPPQEFVRAVGQKLFIPCEWLYAESDLPKWTFKAKDGSTSVIKDGVQAKGLEIAAVAMKDTGTYTCSASNKYGNESVSAELKQVIDPAKITTNFNTTFKTRLESEYSLVCEASGSPTPTVKLFKLKLDKSGFEYIAESEANTGKVTKTFSKLGISDGGLYQCRADNKAKTLEGVSMAETKNITLEVFAPTEIDNTLSTKKEIVSAIGRNFTIQCVAKGYPHPAMTLLGKNGTVLPTKVTTVKDTVTAKLVVTSAQQTDFVHGKITCTATNAYGSQNRTITITQILKAPAPKDLSSVGNIGLSEIDLKWEVVKGADSYTIFVNATNSTFREISATSDGKTIITKLKRNTFYSISIASVNLAGTGKRSNPVVYKTADIETPPPTEPSVLMPGGLSSGEIAGIIVAIILILLIVVDLFCCFFNNCGFSHCCFETFCASKDKKFLPVDTETNDTQELEEKPKEIV